MFGQGLSGNELSELIARDLGLQVAFPCFPLESSLGHTACCIVQKTWLNQLHNGTATLLPVRDRAGLENTPATATGNSQGEVNVFINVISKKRPLTQDNWTRTRVFAAQQTQKVNTSTKPVRKAFTTLTSISSNDEWNITAEAYVKEILSREGKGDRVDIKAADNDAPIDYSTFRPIIESEDCGRRDEDVDESTCSNPNSIVSNIKLIEHILDTLYPTTRRYKVISSDGPDSAKRLVLRNTKADLEESSIQPQAPANIASATVVIETDSAHYCFSPHRSGGATGLTTLHDLLRFNPGNLNSMLKKGFLVFQLLKAVKALHRQGIIHGGIQSSNIFIDENLWITLGGIKCSVPLRPRIEALVHQHVKKWQNSPPLIKGTERYLTIKVRPGEISEEATVMKWAKGEISNFTYLMILNRAAGRRLGDPNVHPIFPWITDFTGSDVSHGWRDLSKTKFRLNKGDEQLDFTFDGPVPHHITDILSDITYYVYMARQIPIPVLCQFVRSKYEANEYPSSIRRLYEWTPDECIPEFYTDPSIFTSIHNDMPDMALPKWAKTPEEFIRIHREALESDYVSQHLHKWIDLTFGYRLSGPGAIEAKNVALSLFPGQSDFMKHGVIQLFTDPHPQKLVNWSLAKADFFKSQAAAQTSLERATKITKRRSAYRIQNERPQFVDKVSDLLFRPAGPTRSKSLRQPSGSRPSSMVITANERELLSASPGLASTSANSALLSPTLSIAQDAGIAPTSTRPEALVQLIQSEPIDLSRDINEATFTEELEHFERTFYFGSKYHFMNDEAAVSMSLADMPASDASADVSKYEETFEYMQSWDVYCLGGIFREIYLAEDIPNNGIVMAMRPQVTVEELTKTRRIPIAVSGTIIAMLKDNWKSRPKIDDILRKTIPTLSCQSPNIAMFVPTVIADIYDFLAMVYTCPENMQLTLANKWIDRICGLEDETFDIALPVFVHLFTTDVTRAKALALLPKLGQRLGIKRTKKHFLKPILTLFETSRPILPKELLELTFINDLLRRFGISTFLQQLFPYYLEALTVDYGPADSGLDDASSGSYTSQVVGSSTREAATAPSNSMAALSDEDNKKPAPDILHRMARVASDAFIAICRSIGPILTSKHVMKLLSRLGFKDPISLPLLKETLGGIAQEFGSTFALVQFSHIIHLLESVTSSFTARTSITMKNLLGLLSALVPHMYDTQLVTELKNGGSELIYRLIEPTPNKPSGRPDPLSNTRLSVSRHALDFILQLSFSLSRHDWERQIAPILQKYFSGFGPDMDEVTAKPASAIEVQRNEQMMYAYGQLCSCVGQEAMQSMIPASEAIERLIAARLASKEFGNSPLRSLGSITAQGKFVLTPSSSSTFWQQQKSQQARDLANTKKMAFSTKDLWSATSAGMSKALAIFDSSKKLAVTPGAAQGNGQAGAAPPTSATSALVSVSASNSGNTLTGLSVMTGSSAPSTFVGLAITGKDGASGHSFERTANGVNGGGGSGLEGLGHDTARSPTEALSTGSLSPVLSSAPARKNRQTFGSPGKAKTAARLEQLRFLSTNQEEMAKSMQFAFNDWKLQGLEGHSSAVRVICANEYQHVLATGSRDKMVKLWSLDIHRTIENPDYADAGSGCLMTYNGHRRGAVFDLHFATGGGSFGTGDIVASCDGQIQLWDPETGKTLHQFVTGKTPVVTMAPIYRSRYIVAGQADNTLSFLDSHTHANLHNWRSTSFQGVAIKVVTTNSSETLIATGFSNGTVTLLEARTGSLVGSWRASDNEITQMKFYTNDILITSAPADHMVSLWNVQTLSLIKSIRGVSEIVSLEIFKEEIITMHYNNSISFTPINDDSLAYTSKFKSSAIKSSISCISILPMNQLLVLGCMEGDLYLYA
ncbi:WD repeat-containing protein 81 [Podila epigama]|nr:WD repeat-containing protein 81 [Podila epigama]